MIVKRIRTLGEADEVIDETISLLRGLDQNVGTLRAVVSALQTKLRFADFGRRYGGSDGGQNVQLLLGGSK